MVQNATAEAGRTAPKALCGLSDVEHQSWLDKQYLRDLETLDRIELQREECDPCFFLAMGELAAGRALG